MKPATHKTLSSNQKKLQIPSMPYLKRHLLFQAGLAVYLMIGFLGALWITDEWDAIRKTAIGYFGLPTICLYWLARAEWPKWHLRFPTLNLLLLSLQIAVFSLGHIALFNAVSGDKKPLKVFIQDQTTTSMEWNRHRGGLGILFKQRW